MIYDSSLQRYKSYNYFYPTRFWNELNQVELTSYQPDSIRTSWTRNLTPIWYKLFLAQI